MKKVCKKCGENKALEDYNDTVGINKRGDCKSCESAYTKAYYLRNRDHILLQGSIREKRIREELKELKLKN
jgi:hypothetical protein